MKFMHLADVHLGAAPDAGCFWSEDRKREIWETFRLSLEDAAAAGVDLILIAGDLFHRQPALEELREADYLFRSLPKTRIVLIAGNHDYLTPTGPFSQFRWSRNVVLLAPGECECVRFPEIRTEVYGFSYDRQEITEPLYDTIRPGRSSNLHILLAHGGDSRHIPISRSALEESGFDYIALGHIHKPQSVIQNKAAYSGALEPIDSLDTGPHGYIMGETFDRYVDLKFVPRAKREYRKVVLQCTPEDTSWSLRDRLEKEISDLGWQHIYRVILEGEREAGSRFDTELLKEYGMILDVEDHTGARLDLESLRRKYSGGLIDRYITSFEKTDTAVEEKALRYGLEALLTSQDR